MFKQIAITLGLVLFGLTSSFAYNSNPQKDNGKARTIKIEATDQLRFSVEEITAKPGEELHVVLTTASDYPANAMSHNFVLLTAQADASKVAQKCTQAHDNAYISPEVESDIIAHTDLASGGKTVEVTFKAPEEPGSYTYLCTFPGHFMAGMKGTLVVK